MRETERGQARASEKARERSRGKMKGKKAKGRLNRENELPVGELRR